MPAPPPAPLPGDAESFAFDGLRGEVAVHLRPPDLAAEVRRLTDPGAALETLHWGRNYIYRALLDSPGGPVEVAVKQFRGGGARSRLRRRLSGSKAEKSWRIARRLLAAGILTPEPVMLVEPERPDGPSFFVTRHLADVFEARYLLRAVNAGEAAEHFPGVDVELFLTTLGRTLRRLHDAGFWHRDISSGNVLVDWRGGGEPPRLYLIDLNRSRAGRRLGTSRRSRDLCRLMIFRRDHQRLFLDAYWGGDGASGWQRFLYRLHHDGFLLKNRVKAGVRGTLRGVVQWLHDLVIPRRPHAHIPAAPAGAGARDRTVWDALSDQPHQHTGKLRKLAVRLADSGAHAEETAVVLAALPRIWARYRALRRDLHSAPVPWGDAGVCLRPYPEAPDELLAAVDELGARHLLLRLHPWQESHDAEEELARELAGRGYDLAFSLPQNRELVRDPGRWRAVIEELGERFAPYGRSFQIGQAINRSKWGVWTLREYARLAEVAAEVLRRHPGVELLGPSVIDFEPHATAAALNLRRTPLRFDAVASLLYVDRRGAPENPQAGFDTVGKVLLLKAIAETARNSSGRCWITEVNWPLREGPHAPAGRSVAVDEETQADYLARYYLLTLGSGAVERVYWWQLSARGYGLAVAGASGRLRRRPAFRALATLIEQLAGAQMMGPLAVDAPARLYRFRTAGGGETLVGWSPAGGVEAELPARPLRVIGRDGGELPRPAGARVTLSGSPRYFHLAD